MNAKEFKETVIAACIAARGMEKYLNISANESFSFWKGVDAAEKIVLRQDVQAALQQVVLNKEFFEAGVSTFKIVEEME